MFPTRNEIIAQFRSPVFIPHRNFQGMETFSRLSDWAGKNTVSVELPRMKIAVSSIDYLRNLNMPAGDEGSMLRFQQNCYRLWYQVDGHGILHNATRNVFGTAKPGLLGLMEIGERYSYLHQKGPFECFLMEFSVVPSQQAKCYWNSEVEGKLVLPENSRLYFENLIFDLIRVIARQRNSRPGLNFQNIGNTGCAFHKRTSCHQGKPISGEQSKKPCRKSKSHDEPSVCQAPSSEGFRKGMRR